MRVLVIGANGFVGRGVSEALSGKHEVIPSYRGSQHDGPSIDLQDPKSIADALNEVRPDAIVDCVGIVENSDKAADNPVFTRNLLEQVAASALPIKRVVIMGSAGEYGPVEKLPVSEDTPRRATSPYGVSKIEEVDTALDFREKGLPVVVARLFNPIGSGMPDRMIIPGVMRQLVEVNAGRKDTVEVGRLDAKRDYIDVADVGNAVAALLSKTPKEAVYNIGSGVSTTNRQLVELILAESGLKVQPNIVETSDTPEPLFAVQADISRLHNEFGWEPRVSIEDTVRSVIHGDQ